MKPYPSLLALHGSERRQPIEGSQHTHEIRDVSGLRGPNIAFYVAGIGRNFVVPGDEPRDSVPYGLLFVSRGGIAR
jgi:hypothetical protein